MEAELLHKKKLHIPKLRFKEFGVELLLSKFGKVVESNLYGPRFNADDYSEIGNVKTIRGTDLSKDGEIKYQQVPLARIDENTVANHKLIDGDIVMITTADCGATGVFRKQEIDYLSSAYGVRIRLNKLGYPYYFKYFFQTRLARKEINSYIRKATVANLPGSDILKIKLYLPFLPEQQKIATFLSAVDEKIQLLNRKKELLEQYKKGVMQQLFSSKLRFKDEKGKSYPKWEEKRLGEIGNTFNGLTGKTKENFGEGKPYIQYMQIFASPKIDITKCGLVQIDDDENQPKVQYGDIFFTTSSETTHEIGFTSVLQEKVGEMYLNSFCFGFRPNSLEQLNPAFASYLFRNEIFRKIIIKLAQGSTRYNMSKVQLMKLKVSLPCYDEQRKIADYLSNLDQKIELISSEISGAQEYKKGLLQQMFV